ncbi:hypothetical protein APUTEX25_001431 [Auxenochlorella protothecoides]|uniref:TF-B3 domain-containing protein n=1 Tax=Auxenochlorella protothecoides TaxID=3075 RepID=A0A3M7L3A9_AUXPR|nr:hypothetical protein APUTEX25_001431 [Auxenochlorella protothecoides]|eukprot:RMZ56584.1 hypothetical protein APUTEX25_001431 [Auxenochlorella protothecoides]
MAGSGPRIDSTIPSNSMSPHFASSKSQQTRVKEEARERGRAPGREGDAPANFNSLFKHRLVIVDEADEAWPVQYEGFMSSGQRHFRLTSGWSGLMRVQNVTIGDTLALERWTEDRTVIHLRIIRRQGREGEALPRPPA